MEDVASTCQIAPHAVWQTVSMATLYFIQRVSEAHTRQPHFFLVLGVLYHIVALVLALIPPLLSRMLFKEQARVSVVEQPG